ncbi:MAG: AMP-dependent synthetase/ligase [Candidatus Nanopelagicales bacterium]
MQIAGSLETPLPAHAPTLAHSILDRIAASPDLPAFSEPVGEGRWRSHTYAEWGSEVSIYAAALIDLGLDLADCVAICSQTRLAWITIDSAIMCAGGANTTIYPSTNEAEVAFMLADSSTKILVAEDADQAAKALHQREALPELRKIVLIDGEGDGDFVISMAQLRSLGVARLAADPEVVDRRVAQLTPDSLATVIYTSGTTGRAKGVELPHRCWVFEGAAIDALHIADHTDVLFLWLPLSHVFGKVMIALQMQLGFQTAVDGRIPELVNNLAAVRPTVMPGVPRVFEKIYIGAQKKASEGSAVQARVFHWAFNTSAKIKEAERQGQNPGLLAGLKMKLASKLVFSKIQALTGGRIRFFVSGSAALNVDVARWFDAAGMPILEGYGLSENSAVACVALPDSLRIAYVGPPIPGSQVKIAEDGEVLLRGPHVMRGYRNLPAETAEVLSADGWLSTGDIGELDSAGRLRITDRKNDMVKTSGGKYIAPGAIAARFKSLNHLASNLVVHATNRNYATALVALDPEALAAFAQEHSLTGDFAELSQHPAVRAEIQASIDELNAGLNRWETIKKFCVLERDLTEDSGELTASMKVKRKVVEEHFAKQLDSMYTS